MADYRRQAARGRRERVVAVAVKLVLATFVLLAATAPALGHGGGTPQLVDIPAGPYHIFAWTNPDPARVGTLHVTVALVDPAADKPVLGADVQVRITPLEAGTTTASIAAPATHAKATIKTYYETDLVVPAAGPWRVTISYVAPQGAGSAEFDLTVQEKTLTNWLFIGGGALALAAIGWFFWPRKPKAVDNA